MPIQICYLFICGTCPNSVKVELMGILNLITTLCSIQKTKPFMCLEVFMELEEPKELVDPLDSVVSLTYDFTHYRIQNS